jgi:hypothetical protein
MAAKAMRFQRNDEKEPRFDTLKGKARFRWIANGKMRSNAAKQKHCFDVPI